VGKTKLIGIILLALGAVLLYFGINSANAPVEELSEAFTGRYSNETMMYLVCGGVAAVAGLIMLIKK
jgi:hypothetical protein